MSVAGTYHEKALKFGGHLVVAVDVTVPVTYVEFGPSVLNDTYDSYYFELSDLQPSTINTHLAMVLSGDGSTFPSSSLSWQRDMVFSNGAAQINGSVREGSTALWHYLDYQIQSRGVSGYIGFSKGPPGFVNITPFRYSLDGVSSNQNAQMYSHGGGGSIAFAVGAIRFYYNGGNVQFGKIRLYGLVK